MSEEAVVLVEWFSEHWYKVSVNEKTHYIPSVTTKLGIIDKPFLAKWRGDIGNREADLRVYEASQMGTRIHWAWATALKGGAVIYDPWKNPVYSAEGLTDLGKKYHGNMAILRTQEEMAHLHKLQLQFKALQPLVLGVEQTVFDLEYNDAGTIDSIYKMKAGDYQVAGKTPLHIPEGLWVHDLKSGKTVDEENVWLQTAPYLVMYEKTNNVKAVGCMVTHTNALVKSGISGLKTLLRSREQIMDQDYPDYRRAAKLWERDHKEDQPHQYSFPSIITLN